MLDHSFTFDGVDAREAYGIVVEKIHRPLFAKLREREMEAPFISGTIDFGAKFRENQLIKVDCGSSQILTRDQAREVAYWLSAKAHLIFYDEPDKYYVGRIYEDTDVEELVSMKKFTLPFKCDHCAYGQQVTRQFNRSSSLEYNGTEETPMIITITNNNAYPLNGLTITMKEAVKQ